MPRLPCRRLERGWIQAGACRRHSDGGADRRGAVLYVRDRTVRGARSSAPRGVAGLHRYDDLPWRRAANLLVEIGPIKKVLNAPTNVEEHLVAGPALMRSGVRTLSREVDSAAAADVSRWECGRGLGGRPRGQDHARSSALVGFGSATPRAAMLSQSRAASSPSPCVGSGKRV